MPQFSSADVAQFHQKLHEWYAAHGRHDLPWRNTSDAYAIYISEVMLQQTQVKTVLARFYAPFLQAFPTLQALSDAPQDAVMKRWEGLGYYSRAANLHKAAKLAAPQLAQSVDELLQLPGIGRNTAHAIAAFAYHQPVPVMEANVKRVLCRVFAFKDPKPDALWQAATQLLDTQQPFDYNQAMMDVGAMLCTKRQPNCAACPANHLCKGQTAPQDYPQTKRKMPVPVRTARIIVWQNPKGELWLEPRETAFLGGLYAFAEYPLDAQVVSLLNTAYPLKKAEHLGDVSQTYSHFKMNAQVWRVQVEHSDGAGWRSAEQIKSLALSGIDHKVLALV